MYQRRINWLTSIQVAIILGTTLVAFSPSLQAQDRKGSPSDPVYARDLDTISRKPYYGGVSADLSSSGGKYNLYFDRNDELPGNASMVIEYASGSMTLPKGVAPMLRLETDGSGYHFLNLAPLYEKSGFVTWIFSHPVRIYASRGSEVRLIVGLSDSPAKFVGSVSINVSGYKETVPYVVPGGPVVVH